MFEFKKSTPELFDQFISDLCETGDWKTTSSNALTERYSEFCLSNKVRPSTSKVVGNYLKTKGFEPVRIYVNNKQMRAWYGIGFKSHIVTV